MNIQTNLPTNAQVSECVTQMIKKQPCTHSQRVQGWAQLRLADFSPVLNEWAIDQAHISDKLAALPQVANALKTPKLPQEHAEKLIAFIQHHTAQGQQTAQLYWAYCLATGKYTTQNPAEAVKIVHQLQNKNDWRGTRFLGEMFALAPLAAVDLLAEDIQTHSKAHHAQNPQLNLSDILQQCQAFATSPAAIKFIVRTQLETAIKLWVWIAQIHLPNNTAAYLTGLRHKSNAVNIWLPRKTSIIPTPIFSSCPIICPIYRTITLTKMKSLEKLR